MKIPKLALEERVLWATSLSTAMSASRVSLRHWSKDAGLG